MTELGRSSCVSNLILLFLGAVGIAGCAQIPINATGVFTYSSKLNTFNNCTTGADTVVSGIGTSSVVFGWRFHCEGFNSNPDNLIDFATDSFIIPDRVGDLFRIGRFTYVNGTFGVGQMWGFTLSIFENTLFQGSFAIEIYNTPVRANTDLVWITALGGNGDVYGNVGVWVDDSQTGVFDLWGRRGSIIPQPIVSIVSTETASLATPEPTSAVLMCTGLLALVASRLRPKWRN